MPIQVFIVADTRLYREGLAHALARYEDVLVAGSAGEGESALAGISALRPEIVLLDMAMLESAATVRAIRAAGSQTRVVALAVPETERHVVACAEAGIAGYVPREASLDYLVATLRSVTGGEMVCSPRIAAGLLRRVAALAAEQAPEPALRELTAREAQILALIDEGLSNKEIARRLYIEVATVKNHVHNILEKLQVSRRGEAAARFRRRGGRAEGAFDGVSRAVGPAASPRRPGSSRDAA